MPPLPDDSHASCAAVCDGRVVVRLFIPVTAGAEDVPSQIEIGGQASVSDLGYGHPMPGFGGWLDVNVSRHVALETRLTWSADSQWDRTLHLAGGFRATFMRTRRFAWYGLALPGLYHYPTRFCTTEVTVDVGPQAPLPTSVTTCAPKTHFALDLGSGLAFAPTSHFVTRIELNRVVHSTPYGVVSLGADYLVPRWDLNAGVSYELGRTLKPQSALPAAGHWTVGSQIGDTFSTGSTGIPTLGAFASYTLSKYCDIDASASAFLSDLESTRQEGGRLLQGLAGVKIGVREGPYGVFFKARAGANSYSRVFTALAETFRPIYSRSTVPALDLGGVLETYLSATTLLRIDIGETLSFVPSVSIPYPHESYVFHLPAGMIYGLPLRVGFGWRF